MNVLLIHTTPNTLIIAEAIELNKLAFTICAGEVLVISTINAAADKVTISIMVTILREPSAFTLKFGVPSAILGTSCGNAPPNNTMIIAIPKMSTAIFACGLISFAVLAVSVSIDFAKSGSFIFSRNSGSLSRSFPIFQTDIAPASTPIRQAGIHTFIMVNDAPGYASIAAMAAVAALIGLPVSARCDAITEMLSGLSGLILVLVDTSETTGN